MTTVKNEVFIGLYPEKCYLIGRFTFGGGGGGGYKFGGGNILGEFFQTGKMSKFLARVIT